MSAFLSFLSDVWPVVAALSLVGLITYGATMPYIRAERKRREHMEKTDD